MNKPSENTSEIEAPLEEFPYSMGAQFPKQLRRWFYEDQTAFATKKDLASAIGVTYQTVRSWFKGLKFPTNRHCDKLHALTKLDCFGPIGRIAPGREHQRKFARVLDPAKLAEREELRKRQRATLAKHHDHAIQRSRQVRKGRPHSEAAKIRIRAANLDTHARGIAYWPIAEDALLGLTEPEGAEKRGIGQNTVWHMRKQMGFPKGRSGFFRHGERLTGEHFTQFCKDIGQPETQAARLIGIAPLKGRAVHQTFAPDRGRLLAGKLDAFIDSLQDDSRNRIHKVRDFLKSENHQISEKYPLLTAAFVSLGEALRAEAVPWDVVAILEWICKKARDEATYRSAQNVMRTMLFFGLPLREFLAETLGNKPGLTSGEKSSGFRPQRLAADLLARDYRTSRSQIEDVVVGKATPIEPRSLRRLLRAPAAVVPEPPTNQKPPTEVMPDKEKRFYVVGRQVNEAIPMFERLITVRRALPKRTRQKRDSVRAALKTAGYTEAQIRAGISAKDSLIAARACVTAETRLQPGVVAKYHRQFLKTVPVP